MPALYLWHFWRQFGNSFFTDLMTTFLTLLIGSLHCRMHASAPRLDAEPMTYVIPASFLAIPLYRIRIGKVTVTHNTERHVQCADRRRRPQSRAQPKRTSKSVGRAVIGVASQIGTCGAVTNSMV